MVDSLNCMYESRWCGKDREFSENRSILCGVLWEALAATLSRAYSAFSELILLCCRCSLRKLIFLFLLASSVRFHVASCNELSLSVRCRDRFDTMGLISQLVSTRSRRLDVDQIILCKCIMPQPKIDLRSKSDKFQRQMSPMLVEIDGVDTLTCAFYFLVHD